MPKFLKSIPHVLVVLSAVQKAQQNKMSGVLRYARLNGPWDVQLLEDRPYISKLGKLRNWHPDGIITRGAYEATELLSACTKKIPTVFLDAVSPRTQRHSVDQTPQAITAAVADFYLGQGLTHFAYVDTAPCSHWSTTRADAFTARLKQYGYSCAVYEPKYPEDWGLEQKQMLAWLVSLPKPCGLMAALDSQAKQVLDICLTAGIRVPEELAVIGVDNDETICENTIPTLSSVLPDFEGGGYLAAEMLDRLMRDLRRKPEHLVYGVKRIVHRQSSQYVRTLSELAASAVEFIRVNACAGIAVPDIAKALHVSRSVLEKDFKRASGHSVLEEIQTRRLERLCLLLRETALPIGEIGERCGYPTETYLKRLFRKRFGTTMREYRKHPCGTQIQDPPASIHPGSSAARPSAAAPQTASQKQAQVNKVYLQKIKAQVERDILKACERHPLSSSEIATALGHKQLSGNLRRALPKLKAMGLLDYTIPDHPRSRFQRCRLTFAGRRVLSEADGRQQLG